MNFFLNFCYFKTIRMNVIKGTFWQIVSALFFPPLVPGRGGREIWASLTALWILFMLLFHSSSSYLWIWVSRDLRTLGFVSHFLQWSREENHFHLPFNFLFICKRRMAITFCVFLVYFDDWWYNILYSWRQNDR